MSPTPPSRSPAIPSLATCSFGPRPLLVCFSHLRWDFVYQRPQHLMSRAAASHEVCFVEEPLFEDVAAPFMRLVDTPQGVTVAQPVLCPGLSAQQASDAQRVLVGRLLDRLVEGKPGRQRVLWYYTPMALTFSRQLPADLRVYDNMDELSAFAGAPASLLALEDELFRRSDLVFTGGHSLYEAKRDRHRSVHAFPSSIDAAHFGRARSAPADPPDQAALARPRLGFFGVIDERMDLALLDRAAALRPGWQFVMLGPVVKVDPAALPRRPNLHWLGRKGYGELPSYLAHWDVGIMPFAINDATRFISPTKTPEFLAAGVPVVSTPIRDVVRPYGERGLVAIASDADAFVAAAEMLLGRRHAPWRARADKLLATMSWDLTWHGMQMKLDAALAPAAAPDIRIGGRLAAPRGGRLDADAASARAP